MAKTNTYDAARWGRLAYTPPDLNDQWFMSAGDGMSQDAEKVRNYSGWGGFIDGKGFTGNDAGVYRDPKDPTGKTFYVQRPAQNQKDKYDYERASYKLVKGADGKQYLEPAGEWKTYREHSTKDTFQDLGEWAAKTAALAGGAYLAGGGLAGGAAGAGGAAPAAGNGAFLGEGVASGIGGWDAAAGLGEVAAGGGGAAGSVGLGNAAGGAAPNLAATNPALIESAAGTPGYGASSAGTGGGAGTLAGGGLPSWLTDNAGTLGRLAGGLVAAGGLGAAASGSGGPSTSGLQGIATTLTGLGNEQAGIARDQYADALARINANDPMFSQIIQHALNQQTQQGQRSDQLWDSYSTNFLPAAEKYAQTALNYDTPGRRAEAEAAARAGVQTQATAERAAQTRGLNRAGVSLGSGRALTLDNALRLGTAKASVGAADAARRNVETTGLQLLGNTANIGQGIVGTSQNMAGQSLAAGNAASNTMGAQVGTRNAALAPTQAFYGGAASATGQAGNVLNGVANIQQGNEDRRNAGLAGIGGLAGTLLTAPKDSVIGDWLSDPKSKKVHGKVSGKRALATLEGADVVDYTYRPGLGDGGRHVGRMAGKGDAMGADGMRRIDAQSEIGLHQAAIKQISKDVKKLAAEVKGLKRMTLGDVEDARIIREAA